VNLRGLQKIFERRHARRSVRDVLAHDALVAAAGGLGQQWTVGPGVARGWQMANAAGLSNKLAAEPLLLVQTIACLPAEHELRAHRQQAQKQPGLALHLYFLPGTSGNHKDTKTQRKPAFNSR